MRQFDTEKSFLRFFFVVLFISLGSLAVAQTTNVISGPTEACVDDPVAFKLTNRAAIGLTSSDTLQWWISKEDRSHYEAYKQTKGDNMVLNAMPSLQRIYVMVTKLGAAKPTDETDQSRKKVTLKSTGCHQVECQQTSSGDLLSFGTDFNLKSNYPSGTIYDGSSMIYESFPDGVDLDLKDRVTERFPIISKTDAERGVGTSNDTARFPAGYLPTPEEGGESFFLDMENGNNNQPFPFDLKFRSPDYRVGTNSVSFNIVMRCYFYIDCDAYTDGDFAVWLHTTTGSEVCNGKFTVRVNDLTDPTKYYTYTANHSEAYKMSLTGRSGGNNQQGEGPLRGQRLQSGHVYKIDVIFYGRFCGNREPYDYTPKFEYPSSSKCKNNRYLLDYIGYEQQTVCVTPRSACKGDWVEVAAAGFRYDADYTWKFSDGSNIPSSDIEYVYVDGKKKRARIRVNHVGTKSYRVISSLDSRDYVDFNLTGEDCEDVLHPLITGTDPVCIGGGNAVTSQYSVINKESLKFMTGTKDYHWTLTAPSGAGVTEYITSQEGPEHDRIVITFPPDAEGSDSLDKPYIITMVPYIAGVRYGEYEVTKEIYLRKIPDISMLTMDVGTICPGQEDEAVDTARISGLYMLKDKGYTYRWRDYMSGREYSTPDRVREDSIFGIPIGAHSNFCSITDDVKWPVRFIVNNHGCTATLEDSLLIQKMEKPYFNGYASNFTIDAGQRPVGSDCMVHYYWSEQPPASVVFCGEKTVTSELSSDGGITYAPVGTNVSIDLEKGMNVFRYIVTDACNQADTIYKKLWIRDQTPPTITCPDDVTLLPKQNCDTMWKLVPPTVSDNCDADVRIQYSLDENVSSRIWTDYVPNMEEQMTQGSQTIFWKAIDESGNADSCSYVVTVRDEVLPEVLCAENKTLSPVLQCDTVFLFPKAVGSDNCTAESDLVYQYSFNGGEFVNYTVAGMSRTLIAGPNTMTWKVIDLLNNQSATCTQTITVTDLESPTITCPANEDLHPTQSCDTLYLLVKPTASDNCTKTAADFRFQYSVDGGAFTNYVADASVRLTPGTHTISWKAFDTADNESAVCDQTVKVSDNVPPTIVCPPDAILYPLAGCDSSYVLVSPTGDDNCTPAANLKYYYSVEGDAPKLFNAANPEPEPLDQGSYVIEWYAVDASGNESAVCPQTVSVLDTVRPIISIETSDDPNGACNPTIVAPTFSARDNCDGDLTNKIEVTKDADQNLGGCMVSRTWRANVLDESGNAAHEVSVTYTWKSDEVPPAITGTLPDLEVEGCDLSVVPAAASSISAFEALGSGLDVSDNCTTDDDLVISSLDASPVDTCPILVVRTYTITDECGKSTTIKQNIYIQQPDFQLPQDGSREVSCATDAQTAPTLPEVKDGCGNVLTPSALQVDELPTCNGDVRYRYTYKDCANHIHVWTFTYNVRIPDFSTPSAGAETIKCKDAAVEPALPDVTDFCGRALSPSGYVVTPTPMPDCEGTVTYTYTYEDCASHTQTWDYVYTIEKHAPTIDSDGFESSQNISCISDTAALAPSAIPTALNDCGEAVIPTLSRVFNWETGKENCKGTISFVYTYTDCGKSSSWRYDYILDDDVKPVFTCPPTSVESITVGTCTHEITLEAPDVTTPCTDLTISYKIGSDPVQTYTGPFKHEFDLGATTVYWYAVDACQNEAVECSHTYDITFKPGFVKKCPDNPELKLDVCNALTWSDVKTHLTGDYAASFTSMECPSGNSRTVDPIFYYKKQSDPESAYVLLTNSSEFEFSSPGNPLTYDLKWLFVYEGVNIETVKDSCFSTVLLTDISAPTADCSVLHSITLRPKGCDTVYTVDPPIGAFHDPCTPDDELTYVFFLDRRGPFYYGRPGDSITFNLASGSHWISWVALDNFQNMSILDTCGYGISVVDANPPVITCSPVANVDMDVYASCDTTFNLVAPEVNDACGVAEVYYKLGDGVEHVYDPNNAANNSVTFKVGDTLVKWYAKDASNNYSDTCESHFTVRDAAKPTIRCVDDVEVKVYTHCDTTLTLDPPAANDNCSPDQLKCYYKVGSESEVLYSGSASSRFALGSTIVTWRVVDLAGNDASCSVTYTVKDSSGIIVHCPDNDNLVLDVCEDQPWSEVRTHLTGDYAATATRTDCEHGVDEELTPTFYYKKQTEAESAYVALTDAFNFEMDVTYDLKWLFEKGGGNMESVLDSCISHVLLTDTTAPVANCNIVMPALRPHGCDTLYLLEAPIGAFHDNCTPDADLAYWYAVDDGGFVDFAAGVNGNEVTLAIGKHHVYWYAVDAHGNRSDTCSYELDVLDILPPTVECDALVLTPYEVTQGCEATVTLTAPAVTDCENYEIFYKIGNGEEQLYTAPVDVTFVVGDTLVKWYAKDNAGLTSDTCVKTYSVVDVAAPVFNCPADTAFKLYHNCDTTMSLLFPPVTDNCEVTRRYYRVGAGSDVEYTAPVEVFFPLGVTTITWTAYDASDNKAECVRGYSVTDTTGITTSCPTEDDVTINTCDDMSWDDVLARYTDAQKATATRMNCANNGEAIDIEPKMEYKKASDPIDAYASLLPATVLAYNTSYDIRWVFEKSGENMETVYDTCDSKVILRDTSVPTMDCSKIEDIVLKPVTCDTMSYKFLKPEGVFDDNCGEANLTYFFKLDDDATFTEFTGSNLRDVSNGSHTIVWKVADQMGNESGECGQSLSVVDTIAPDMTCPSDMTLKVVSGCSIASDLPVATATDACGDPKVYYSFDGESFSLLGATFNHTLAVGDTTIYWYAEDVHGNVTDTCQYQVTVLDTIAPVITCPADTAISLTTGCATDVTLRPATASDNCAVDKIYYSYDNATFTALDAFDASVTKNFSVGGYTVYWFATDIYGVHSDTCQQKVSILDDHGIDLNCPTSTGEPFIVETCTDLPWKSLSDSLSKLNMNASASYVDCETSVETPIDSVIMKVSLYGADNWSILKDDDPLLYNTPYDIRWVFVKTGEHLVTKMDSCQLPILLKDTTAPTFNCDDIDPDSAVVVAHGVCELPYKKINLNTYTAHDNCDGDIIGVLSTSTNLADSVKAEDKFVVGRVYNLYWIFQDKTGNKVYCDQKLMLNTDLKPVFDCDSLKNSPITTVLHGVCETDSAQLGIQTPIAHDACTNDPVPGVGHRKSGLAMNDKYVVGRDTIVWVFQSIYSTTLDSCEQYIFIQSDNELAFDCDSLNRAVIDTVLHDVCEIDSASLKIQTPFALDVCTNDTIWGVGRRKSGSAMNDPYLVGRDTIVWRFVSEYSTSVVECEQFIYIKSDKELLFDCDSLKNAPIDTVLHGVCEIDSASLNFTVPFALDACTNDTVWGVGRRTSGLPMGGVYPVGRDTIVWTFTSEYSTAIAECEQYIYIKSDKELEFDCDSLKNAPIERVLEGVCEIDSVGLNMIVPFALDACTKDTIWGVGRRTSGEPMGGIYKVGRDTIVWTFTSEYSTAVAECEQYIYIKSDKALEFDCDSLKNAPIERVLHGVCEIDSAGLNMIVPFALDACTRDTIWGVGERKSGEPMGGTYKVGRDTITWTFISEYSTDTVLCDQYIYIKSDKGLEFDCDSLKNAPIERVLEGVCEIDSVGLNLTVPFALDACTKDTIWGVGERKSGEPMGGIYKVGRDTITWTFISEYSTDTVLCDQYIFIQSDMEPLFDCDSLKKAVIDTVLHGVCEIDSAGLNYTVPFALDACTKDTIWGVGERTSGLPMGGIYKVGRDTIVWRFISEYSTDTAVCEQYIFIQSDLKPKFDCDSLKNAPIERVLEGVCEIDSAGLNMIVPFALDACTNDTVWGRGTRTSGEPMGGTYKVGRDTIIWVFDSEYSTNNDTCEQYIFIQSDLKPKFDCDSLKNAPIHKVLVDTCEISPADLNVNTPFALDACTNDTIWGVGTRKSGKSMTDNYVVGRDTIVWVFDSEYSTANDTCEQYVFIQSNLEPIFNCDSLKNSPIEKVLDGVCEITPADLGVNTPFAFDACTGDTVWGVGERTSGRAMTDSYVVGHDTIVWRFISEFSIDTAICEQYVFIQSNKGIEFDCDSLKNHPITTVLHGVCEVDSATLNYQVPFALDGCTNDTVWGVGVRKSGLPMGGKYYVGRDTITWTFSSIYTLEDVVCDQYIFIQSDMAPLFDCDSLKNSPIDTVLHGVCEIDSASLNFTVPFALDACTKDTIWGVGTRSSGEPMGGIYKVGRDTITWKFISEYSTDTTVCDQYIFIQSDMAPLFDCDSLKNAPIERDIQGVCEIDSADMNFTVPFALDACTKDTIWGVGRRTSGLSMGDKYHVGRDTIIWTFASEFSSDTAFCEQYIFIRSDMAPKFDCDSLMKEVIDTVLHEVCEIDPADLHINTPFAIDVCTNDTVWGKAKRKSGLSMDEPFRVGRDTLIWRFVSTYSTIAAVCEQPVFIRSDKKLLFDCDSLNNAPIERVLEGVCEISAAEIDIKTPFAIDACTNEKIYGVGVRKSGKGMDENFVVGRDTIVWTFISEFSTDTSVCEQYVYIQSDLKPIFNCDSLKQEVIEKVLEGVCEISAADLNIATPIAYDACTKEPIPGVGTRKSGRGMDEPYVVGRDTIIWVFDSEYSTLNDTCEQYVYIQSDMKPKFDCDSLKNAPIEKVLSGVCEISAADLNVNTPFALDVCTNDTVWGVGTRKSGRAMTDNYVVGHDTIVWVFDSEYSTNNDTCEQYVFIQSDMEPSFNCDSLKNTPINKVLTGVCEISAADLNVNTPFALDACTKDTVWGVGQRTSGRDMDSAYVVGRDTIIWTFTSLYSTAVATCEQYVFIQSDLAPEFNCDELKDTTLYLAMDKCEIPAGEFVLPTPVAKDACTGDDVPGVPTRQDGLTLEDAYPVGTTTVTWTFISPYSTTPLTCEQKVTVKDTIAPVPHCEDLDTIHADITATSKYKNVSTYEEAVAAGLVAPTLDDLCDGVITATGLREDGSPLEGNFEIGLTTIVWTYTDKSGNSSECTQIVKVEDFGTDTLFCPGNLDGKVFACLEDIPAAYDSYEAFKDAGGSFTTEYKIVDGSFRYKDNYQGDSCEMVVTRIYQVTNTRGGIDSCQEVIYVRDTIAPHFDFVLNDTTLSCEDSIFAPITVTATDNCDGGVRVEMVETNNRNTNPSSCEYFNYDIKRAYYAYDRCGNVDTMIQTIAIRDTVSPSFNYPEGWRDTVLAKSLKGCMFEVPDFTMDVKSMVEDNCTELNNLTVVQTPAPGSTIQNSMWVWVRVSDMCGNADSVAKYVRVQSASAIVSLSAYSVDTCVTDEVGIFLASQSIRFATGYVEQVMPNGRIRKLPSVFSYDYYRGSIAHENLIYSDNPKTYRSEFAEYVSMYGSEVNTSRALTTLNQQSESDLYWFVAMDTTTGCSDTASAYINVLERPKISMISADMPVCEGNMIQLDPYLRCIDDMGTPIIDQYWMLDGERFDPTDSVAGAISYEANGKVISYYAENRCGSSSSLNSHNLLSCYGDSLTTQDSLIYLDNDTIAFELLRLNQLVSKDSILLNVHKRYNPDSIIIETDPHDPARIWNGESITLTLKTDYDYHYLVWRKVKGKYDMENYNSFVGEGFIFNDPDDEQDEVYETSGFMETPYIVDYPTDTAYYYVSISDGVCPETPSRLTEVDVLQQIPTAFTPHTKDGLNDVFMKNHHVTIFDRYGEKIFEGNDGWPGTQKGHQADPAVYFYELEMRNGLIVRGTIEIVKIK